MEFLTGTKSPRYRGTSATTTRKRGLLADLWAYVFGGSAVPSYRTADGATTAGDGTPDSPQYKTAPTRTVIEPCEDEPTGEMGGGADEIEIDPREIHIYTTE